MQNPPSEAVKEYLARAAIDALNHEASARECTARLVALLSTLYRVTVVAGVCGLVWNGGSPWLLLAGVPLMFFAPKLKR